MRVRDLRARTRCDCTRRAGLGCVGACLELRFGRVDALRFGRVGALRFGEYVPFDVLRMMSGLSVM
jgi:hypothetical protein